MRNPHYFRRIFRGRKPNPAYYYGRRQKSEFNLTVFRIIGIMMLSMFILGILAVALVLL